MTWIILPLPLLAIALHCWERRVNSNRWWF